MIGIGLIGAGRIGVLHAQIIRGAQTCRIAAIYDQQRAAAEDLAAAVGGKVCEDAEALVLEPSVDIVFICSPTDTHVDMVTRAARAGKAVFCEKPIDLDIGRVQQCLDVLTRYPVPFTLGFHRRFDPHHRALYDEVRHGRIGEVEQIRIVSRDPAPPPVAYIRRSGGIFRDMMIHDLDQCRALLGEEFVGIFAIGSVLTDPQIAATGDFDTATATLWSARGASCTIQNSRRCAYGFDQRIEIFGSKGRLALENLPLTMTSLFDATGLICPTLPRHFPQRYQEAYRQQLMNFVDAVSTGSQPVTTALDGLWSLVLADAAERSARSGHAIAVTRPAHGLTAT